MSVPILRMIAWEVTRNCNLDCVHCRAAAGRGPYENELSTEECFHLLDDIVSFSRPVIILTGGEPLLRPDIFKIAQYAADRGLRTVMAVNGTLLTEEIARKILDVGIKRISISIDGAEAPGHDSFRGVEGAFRGALSGIEAAKEAGLEFQLNTTVTKRNIAELPALLNLSVKLGAAAHHIFLLVPTGRGEELKEEEISPLVYEETLNWFSLQEGRMPIKVTCAPHYYRILRQKGMNKGKQQVAGEKGEAAPHMSISGGCLGGKSFCFISHTGQLQPCGYLELNCGNVRKEGFEKAWKESEIFNRLRDIDNLKGKCGRCEFRKICGGCRARAYVMTGDYLEEEPYCVYEPEHK